MSKRDTLTRARRKLKKLLRTLKHPPGRVFRAPWYWYDSKDGLMQPETVSESNGKGPERI